MESIFLNQNSIDTTIEFVVFSLLAIVFLAALIAPKSRLGSFAPGLCSNIGILGTFVGIAIALYHFKPDDIQNSVQELLKGMRVAFVTSVAGLFTAILIKILWSLLPYKHLKNSSNPDRAEAIVSAIDNLRISLTSDQPESFKTTVSHLRSENKAAQIRLIKSFEAFADRVAENNNKALVEAIQSVMRDFNTKINEQIGDNFQHLNKGIENLVLWQQQHKDELTSLKAYILQQVEALDRATQNLSAAAKANTILLEQSRSIEKVASTLEPLLTEIGDQVDDLSEKSQAFASIASSAREAFPALHFGLNQLTKSWAEGVESNMSRIKIVTEKQQEVIDRQLSDIAGLINRTKAQYEEHLRECARRSEEVIERMQNANAERLDQQLKDLDKALQDELEKSLQSLGNALASLSEKFTKDYSPLTDRLREVVRIAERISA